MKSLHNLLFCFMLLLLNGCSTNAYKIVDLSPEPSAGVYALVKVFFATDRNQTGDVNPKNIFGSKRSNISYGECEVSIPRDHRMGELESPFLRIAFNEDPEKHVVLLHTDITSKEQFFTDMSQVVQKSSKKATLLFVHGYNVTFEDAARRTAQLAYDLGFDGAPTFYSWPSAGAMRYYTVDEQNIEWAEANLKKFLDDYFTHSNAQNVYLIAHSMGNRALTRAVISLLREKPTFRSRLKEVILAAPDIDADVFKRDIAPALTTFGAPVTLYASSTDLALAASMKVHRYPRAGDADGGLIVVPGIETIDATNVDTGLIKHSYFADKQSVISDMFYLINDEKSADERFGLQPVNIPDGR
ncbi:alpha/beta hydrolase, partial [Klebsiella variicola]|uniref:alpha/beta hydrolase n=2 Tax=Klebsiella TaxID=570 RepID=UPI00237C07AF